MRLGGLGIPILSEIARKHFESSKKSTAPLVTTMIWQGDLLPNDSYVKTLKLEEKKKRDALNLRYGKNLKRFPSKYPCGQSFNMTHALNCKTGGFITVCHNRVRDFVAQLLTEICNDVEIKPPLQPLEGEITNGITGVNAKPDVRARGFWREEQNAFFDVRITNRNSESQRHLTSEKNFTKHEREEKRQYNSRTMNVEHGTFTPLVFSGRRAKECLKFHKFLAEKIVNKSGCHYENVISIIKCKLSFLILRASLMCAGGSRSLNYTLRESSSR